MINPFWSRVLFRELGPWWTGPLLWDRYCSLSFRSLVFLSYLEAPKKTRRRSRWGKQNSWKLVKPNIAETVATTLWYTSKGSLEFAWISVSQGSMSVSTFCCRVFSTFLFVLIIPILNFADAMGPNLPRWTNVTKKKHRNGRSPFAPQPVPRFLDPRYSPGSPVAPKSPGRLQGCLMWRVLTLLDPVILAETRGDQGPRSTWWRCHRSFLNRKQSPQSGNQFWLNIHGMCTHTRQEWIIIWSGRNWILKHAD